MTVRYSGVFLACVGAISVNAQEFETEIVPLLRRECIDCHGPTLQMSGLRLDRREDALQVIEAGSSEDSLLIQRLVEKDLGVLMPPKFGDGSGLAEKDIKVLRAWIDAGAKWPVEVLSPTRIIRGNEFPLDMAKRHGHPEIVDLLIQAVGK